jgi:hypothetical protein
MTGCLAHDSSLEALFPASKQARAKRMNKFLKVKDTDESLHTMQNADSSVSCGLLRSV